MSAVIANPQTRLGCCKDFGNSTCICFPTKIGSKMAHHMTFQYPWTVEFIQLTTTKIQ